METVKLNNGIEMPQMGYGVYQVAPDECERCVRCALSAGYRMIDTAQAYHNENATSSQVSLAWMLNKKPYIVHIPGTRRLSRLRGKHGSGSHRDDGNRGQADRRGTRPNGDERSLWQFKDDEYR